MEDFKNNNKVLFIPGWLDIGKRHGYRHSLDIWHENIDINIDFKVNFIIAHSIGALAALYNWSLHKNYKLILINPVISKRSILKRWYKYFLFEGLSSSFKKSIKIVYFFRSLPKLFKLFKIPAVNMINNIPKENLFIVYGENDIYLFDKKIIDKLKEKNVSVQKVKVSGHNYELNMDKAVLEIISSII